MNQALDHQCDDVMCSVCTERERVAADERYAARQLKTFDTKKKRTRSVVSQATPKPQRLGNDEAVSRAIDGVVIPDGATVYNPLPVDAAGNPPSDAFLENSGVAEPAQLADVVKALTFILAGNATFTVRSLKTGTRYTYKVSKADRKTVYCTWCKSLPCKCPDVYFVALLTGPDNTSDFNYLGMIGNNGFRLTAKSRMNADSVPVKAFRWVYDHLQKAQMPPFTEIWHEGRCGRCGHKLTVPESIATGLGPDCAGKMGY